LQPLGQFYQVLYSAHDKFQELSRIKIIESVAFFLLLVLVIVFGYVGQLLSLAMSAAILLILMIREKPIDITINRFNIAIIRELIVKGYPILLSALTFNIFFTIDRIFIIGMRGAEEYGYYAIGASIFQIVIFVPESIRQISYRYFNIEYGRQGNSSKLKNGFWYSFLSVCIVMWTLTVIIYNIVPSMIQLLLPEYLPSISIVKVFAMTMAFAAPGMMLSTALYSVHLEKKVLGIYVMAIMIFIIGIVFFIQYEMPTYTVALIISLSHAVSSLMMFSLVTKQPEYQLTKNMLKVVIGALSGLMLIAISFTVGVGEAIAGDNVFVQLLSMVLYLVIVASFLFGLYKRYRNMNDHVFTGNSEEL
jgi:O-antigen/teichoic acid export membrane protein